MKHRFNRTAVAAAVTAVLSATPALAVNISDNGLGEVGLIPYYTVRDGWDTNISVVNTSDRYVVSFKIRFREGANSRDARDFNVYLSPNDVWTATVSMGANGVPFIRTADTTCTAPWITTDRNAGFVEVGQTAAGDPIKEMDFTDIDWTGGTALDPGVPDNGTPTGTPTIERAQEGYVEVIEMGVADPAVSTLAAWAVHGANQNCPAIVEVFDSANPRQVTVTGSNLGCEINSPYSVGDVVTTDSTQAGLDVFYAEYCEPLNLLKVSANLINVNYGAGAGIPVKMLANFYNPNGSENLQAPAGFDINFQPVAPDPNLESSEPKIAVQVADGVPLAVDFFGGEPADPVSSLFSASAVINEYATGGAANAQTAWVVTFPTKNFYVDPPVASIQRDIRDNALPPFTNAWYPYNPELGNPAQAPVVVDYRYYDREENTPGGCVGSGCGGVIPSPLPVGPVIEEDIIGYEVNVINFGSENLLGSQHNYAFTRNADFDSGWLRLGFPRSRSITGVDEISDRSVTFTGLPVIGFSLKTLENGVAGSNLLNYGISSTHAYSRNISLGGVEPGPVEPPVEPGPVEPEPEPVDPAPVEPGLPELPQ